MIEGKKISQLRETTSLNEACCFPVLSRGSTQRITFGTLLNIIVSHLPESGGATEEEIEELRQRLNEHQTEIENLISQGESIESALSQITIRVDGQDRTILEYTNIVQELERVYEQATISGGVVDSSLNTESINPVQNKVLARLIPTQASPENKLADKNFVNSSISTNTAHYISDNGEPFTSLEDLEAYEGTVTQNDYAFITGTDEGGNAYYDRYKADVNGDVVIWSKEYRLNNSSFTAAQWAAISSGITAELVAQIGQGGAGDGTPIGTILSYGGANAPSGYILCDGRAVSRTDYDKLFEKIGTTFGAGDGSTTFNVPDLRDKVAQGANGNLGEELEAGLPNITGNFAADTTNSSTFDGAFSKTNGSSVRGLSEASNTHTGRINFSASDSNDIYGNSDTVQPPAVAVNFIIKATASTGEVPADVELDDDKTTTANVWSASKTNDEIKNVDNKNNYSTTETVIGKWIDGKPIYRKTFVLTSPHDNDVLVNDADTLINAYGRVKFNFWSGRNTANFPFAYDDKTIGVTQSDTDGHIALVFANSNVNSLTCTLEYTKTTDSAEV